MRIAEAARQVMGRAGEHQKPGVDRALAHAASGFAMMYQTVVVLDKNKGAAA
jgi:acetyl-CoA C-acetyltransferase